MKNLVSIVLPTYNGSKYIKNSIESIIKQKYKNWELIIINDCSTDNTYEICNEYTKKDKRIKVYSNDKNKKLPASLNIGFSHACGNYLTWTSDDNMFKPGAIEYMVKYLDKNRDIDLISCDYDFIQKNGVTTKSAMATWFPNRSIELLPTYNIVGACFLYRKEIAKKVGDYDTKTFCAEDYDYWCRIALNGKIAFCEENLYNYVSHKDSLSISKQEQVINMANKVRTKYLPLFLEKYPSLKDKITDIAEKLV